MATPCLITISAPILLNSGTCINLFSNTVSSIELAPFTSVWRSIIWGCISVGKPGWGIVLIFEGFSSFRFPITDKIFPSCSNLTPIDSSSDLNTPKSSKLTFSIFRFPSVINEAITYVPASILSGIIEYSTPCNSSTPSISMLGVPSPVIFAPILFRKFPKSTISGSLAAFEITVFPGILTAAIIKFCVAPTLGNPRGICAPLSLSDFAWIYPWTLVISAPNASNPFKCKSTGLEPMAHPPGSETIDSSRFAIIGPITRKEALICLTIS